MCTLVCLLCEIVKLVHGHEQDKCYRTRYYEKFIVLVKIKIMSLLEVNYTLPSTTPQGTSILSTLCKSYERIAFSSPFLFSSVSYRVAKQPRLL